MEPAVKPLLKILTDFPLLVCQMARIWQEKAQKGEETAFSLPSAATPSPRESWKIIWEKNPYFVIELRIVSEKITWFRCSSKLTKIFPGSGPVWGVTLAHRIGRVLSFFSSRRNWNSPTPIAASVPPHPLVRGGGHTRLWERGWGSPNSDEGTYTVVLYIYKYFVLLPLMWSCIEYSQSSYASCEMCKSTQD